MNSDMHIIEESFNNIPLKFRTHKNVFSPEKLDSGTKAMLGIAQIARDDKLLDLGCGYGFAGIYATKAFGCDVVMSDNNEICVRLAESNCELNGVSGVKTVLSNAFRNVDDTGFTAILCNPPYHADFSVAKEFIEKGFNRLTIGGKMYMVTKREAWYRNKLKAVFGGIRVFNENGYYVFTAEKRQQNYANKTKGGKVSL